jgi:hypothetical protein
MAGSLLIRGLVGLPFPGELAHLEPLETSPQDRGCGLVYFIRDKPSGLVKVGFTRDLQSRFRNLCSECEGPIELLHVIITDRPFLLEQGIHAELAPYRRQGEWFAITWPDPAGLHEIAAWIFWSVREIDALSPWHQADVKASEAVEAAEEAKGLRASFAASAACGEPTSISPPA